MSFGLEIKRLRTESGLTQAALAGKLSVVQGFVSDLENGRRSDCSTATLYALSDALGVPVDHWRPFLAAGEGSTNIRTPAPKGKATKKPKRSTGE